MLWWGWLKISQLNSSKIQMLSPFISEKGILCVGGRIKYRPCSLEKRHPILLNGGHHLAKLTVTDQHAKLLHAGAQQTLFATRERFWITSGRNLCKGVVRNCVRCFRHAPKVTSPIIGNLPASRVAPSSPFTHTGIDFAGPLLLKTNKGRGGKITKCYLCLFVCFSTKAVHLELVT